MYPNSLRPRYRVKTQKNVMIPMRDGTRLAADIFLPDVEGKFPAVLEYIPYRKDDRTTPGHAIHHYFAQRGIAGVRLDIRGTGASEGFVIDEYPPIEHQDGYDAIEWLAKQSWSNGKLGMWGISYGGYTSIQVALTQPPSLKAIAPMYATDDRYSDGDQYRGGAKRGLLSTGTYPCQMIGMNALPPYPEYSGEDWLKIWEEHLEKNTPYILEWLDKQVDSPYWKECVGRRYEQIVCPTFVIGGWMDHFVNSMVRLYANLKVPKKLLMGPWPHQTPDIAIPGPNIDFAWELVRWFAYWLNGEQTGVMAEPPVTIYVQQFSRPDRVRKETRGFWRYESQWPPTRTQSLTLFLRECQKLSRDPSGEQTADQDLFEYTPAVGMAGGPWYGGRPFVMPDDQRTDDALSVVYDTEPLQEEVEILGFPQAVIYASSTSDVAFFVPRLCDIAPDGTSVLVSKGILNATRRNSFEKPEALIPGTTYELEIQLDATSWIFEKGHKIRLAISGSDWPDIWPSPHHATNSIFRDATHLSRLVLLALPAQDEKLPKPEFQAASGYPMTVRANETGSRWDLINDVYGRTVGVKAGSGIRIVLSENIGTYMNEWTMDGRASLVDFGDVIVKASDLTVIERKGMKVEAEGKVVTESKIDSFHIIVDLNVKLNDMPHFSRRWTKSCPRNLL